MLQENVLGQFIGRELAPRQTVAIDGKSFFWYPTSGTREVFNVSQINLCIQFNSKALLTFWHSLAVG